MSDLSGVQTLVMVVNLVLLSVVSPLADWLVLLCNLMVGSLAISGRHWAKLRSGGKFISFWKFVRYLIAETILITVGSQYIGPWVENQLTTNSKFLLGITTGVFGTFFLWVVHTGDFDIKTQGKWVPPTICYITTLANYLMFQTR